MIWPAGRVIGCLAIDPDIKKMWRVSGYTGAVGIEIAAAIVVGYLGGEWLDNKFGTAPWLRYFGLVAGVGAAIKALIRVTKAYKRSLENDATPPHSRND